MAHFLKKKVNVNYWLCAFTYVLFGISIPKKCKLTWTGLDFL